MVIRITPVGAGVDGEAKTVKMTLLMTVRPTHVFIQIHSIVSMVIVTTPALADLATVENNAKHTNVRHLGTVLRMVVLAGLMAILHTTLALARWLGHHHLNAVPGEQDAYK